MQEIHSPVVNMVIPQSDRPDLSSRSVKQIRSRHVSQQKMKHKTQFEAKQEMTHKFVDPSQTGSKKEAERSGDPLARAFVRTRQCVGAGSPLFLPPITVRFQTHADSDSKDEFEHRIVLPQIYIQFDYATVSVLLLFLQIKKYRSKKAKKGVQVKL